MCTLLLEIHSCHRRCPSYNNKQGCRLYYSANNFSTVAAAAELENHGVVWSFRNVDILLFFFLCASFFSFYYIIIRTPFSWIFYFCTHTYYTYIFYTYTFIYVTRYTKTELFVCSNTKVVRKRNKRNEMKRGYGDFIFSVS